MDVDGKITILCYGDSNTYGYHPETSGRYPYEMRWTSILADNLGRDYLVIPEGLNGRTTAYERVGTDWQNGLANLASTIGTHKPLDYIVLMLGTNDCNIDMKLEPLDIADGMRRLVVKAKEMTTILQGDAAKIVVVSPAFIRPEIEGTPFEADLDETSVAKSHKLAMLYEELAKEYGCTFVDASAAEVSAIDCEHLTAKGHQEIAKLIYDAIQG